LAHKICTKQTQTPLPHRIKKTHKICTKQTQTPHPYRFGWTVVQNWFQPTKQDGSVDARTQPKPGRRMLHIHKNGHKRLYFDNWLIAEKYL